MKKIFLFIQLLILATLAYAQSLPIRNYSTDDGLVQSQVSQISQDNNGYIWFLTLGGASKFDGYTFFNYNLATGLATNTMSQFDVNDDIIYFIGNNTISIVEGKNIIKYDQNYFLDELHEKVLNIALTGDSTKTFINVATESKIYRYSNDEKVFKEYYDLRQLPEPINTDALTVRYPDNDHIMVLFDKSCYLVHLHDNSITNLLEELDISLENGGSIGYYGINNDKGEYTLFYTNESSTESKIIQYNVLTKEKDLVLTSKNITEIAYNSESGSSLYYKKDDYYQFVTAEGKIFNYNPLTKDRFFSDDLIQPKKINMSNVVNVYYLNDHLWIGTNEGLIDYNIQTKKTKTYTTDDGLSSNNIQCIYVDREDNIWLGMNGTGVDVVVQGNISNYDAKNGLSHSGTTNCTEGDDGSLWISCDNGLSRLLPDGTIKNYNSNDGLPHNDTWALSKDTNGQIWVGTYNTGLVSFDGKKFINRRPKELEPYSGYLTGIFSDSEGNIWVFIRYYIIKYDKDYNYTIYKQPESQSVYEVVEDSDGLLWGALGNKGIAVMNKNAEILANYPIDTRVFNSIIVGLEIVDKNTILCFTYGEGIIEFDRNTKQYNRIFKSKLQDYGITKAHVRDDDGNLWVGTIKGIVKITKDNIIKEFKKEDGLIGEDVRTTGAFKDSKGVLWFCTSAGLVRIIVEEQNIDSTPPKMIITDFKSKQTHNIINNQKITLAPNDRTISISFTGIDLRNPNRVQYSYILEDFDQDWSPLSLDRSIRYTNLNNGKYTFKVYSIDHAGNKSEIKEIDIVILTPFWKTWWFISLEVLILILIVIGIINWRLRLLKRKNEQLEFLVALRTKQLKEKNDQLLSSIRYAERIQKALLVDKSDLKKVFKDLFILFLPKDIISGDFYWYYKNENYYYLAVVDCTGHGVPGALLSIVGNMLLNEAVNGIQNAKPGELLTSLHENVRLVLSQTNERGGSRDGMEVALCRINKDLTELVFAGANRPLYYFEKSNLKQLKEVSGTRKGIGGLQREEFRVFDDTTISLENVHSLYMYSDGLVDQNNAANKKFSSRYLKSILKDIVNKDMEEQEKIIIDELTKHKENEPQRDDITMIGLVVHNKV